MTKTVDRRPSQEEMQNMLKQEYKIGHEPVPTLKVRDNWRPQSSFICEVCMYWLEQRCRRHSPKGQEGWPATFATDFCGDHKMSKKQMEIMTRDR
jgi:hypothetical protein